MGSFPDEKTPSIPSTTQATSSFAPFRSHFASLSFDAVDHMRFLNFPDTDIQTLHSVVAQFWPKGIKSTGPYGPSFDLKLNGYPWTRAGDTSDNNSCILVRSILSQLFSSGWILHQSVSIARNDSLIFLRQAPPPPPASWLAIRFVLSDRLRLFGPDQEIIGAFRGLFKGLGMWQNEEWKDKKLGVYEIKLNRSAWALYV